MEGYFVGKTLSIINPELKLVQVVINKRSNSIEFTFRDRKTTLPLDSISKLVLIDEEYQKEAEEMITGGAIHIWLLKTN